MAGRLTDRLDDRSDDGLATAGGRGFVGRRGESAVFRSLLDGSAGAVMYVYGPDGIGKTALLHHFGRLAAHAGRPAVRLEAAEILPGEEEFTERIDALTSAAEGRPGPVLLVDGLDDPRPARRALRRELLPLLPADSVVTLAGRGAPSPESRLASIRPGLSRVIRLGPLDAADSRELLARRGVPAGVREEGLVRTRGLPLALALLADTAAQGDGRRGGPPRAGGSPEIVQALLADLLEAAPTPLHRAALEVSAQVLVMTEPLLARLLEVDDAEPYFTWLRGLTAMDRGPRGVRPHDLVRDALDADLGHRDPRRRAALRRRAGAYYQKLFTETEEPAGQRAVLADFAHLYRESPVVGPLLEPVVRGAAAPARLDRLSVSPGPVTGGELMEACTIAAIHEGIVSASLVHDWSACSAARTYTVRGPDGVAAGFYTLIELTGAPPPGAPDDPGVRTACAWLAAHAGLRAGENALLVRFWMSRDEYQTVSPVQTLITLRLTHHHLTGRGPALTLLPFADPEFWAPGCAYVDFARLSGADFETGGRRFGMFVHDWRRVPGLAWLESLTERERPETTGTRTTGTQAAATAATPAATAPTPEFAPEPAPAPAPDAALAGARPLGRGAFAHAVRDALRGLSRTDGLRDSPLLGTRLVAARCGPGASARERAAALDEAIRAAATTLESTPQDHRAFTALHHTYLRPAGTQAQAAEALRLPLATYRRHLGAATARLTELLWREELDTSGSAGRHGAPGPRTVR